MIYNIKWVLKQKFKSDGSLYKYKTHLVVKGLAQIEGINYLKIFSPIMKFQSMRTLVVIVAHHDLELHQIDVKIAFMNSELENETT